MNKNFVRVAAANTKIKLLDVEYNKKQILKYIDFAYKNYVDVINFQELSLTGVSCGEMICSQEILQRSKKALKDIISYSKDKKILISLGLPFELNSDIYPSQIFIFEGKILNLLKKNKLDKEQKSYLSPSNFKEQSIKDNIISTNDSRLKLGFIFEDDFYEDPIQYSKLLENKAKVIFIIGSKPDNASLIDDKLTILKSISTKDNIAIIYTGPSSNESSTNFSYSGIKYIIEAGELLETSNPFSDGLIYSDINLDEINFKNLSSSMNEEFTQIDLEEKDFTLHRFISPTPMIPRDDNQKNKKIKNILNMQAHALLRRLNQLSDKKIFLGLSGGLDSTLALISACYAFEKANLNKKDIHAIIMPGLGTSLRTKSNAHKLALAYGVDAMEISINESVLQHFKDIKHDPSDFSVVFENAQARERTQILMDLSNKYGGIVLGTGNMSEIALGFATYNGDHMSMYAINSGITKTLLREVVKFIRDHSTQQSIVEPLSDILDTPISPELLPGKDGEISQKTEDNIGPYELHDFFLYHTIRNKSAFKDVIYMGQNAFMGKYSKDEIEKWYKIFLRRFSIQQFKRSCMPDGPAIEDFSLNPRNGFIMASDINILTLEE